jgi:2-polyprenyl-6-methoxyphenol hydroxylase-like FAD-dependent oxidoreductase
MTGRRDAAVLIAGGGPVGLTLAIGLGRRGVRCTVVEANETPSTLPKMELCNARTMEIYARLGLDAAIRHAGYPTDAPMDVLVTTSLNDPPIHRIPYPSTDEMHKTIASTNDGSQPGQAYQRISQYTLEPLLRAAARSLPTVTVRFGARLEHLSQTQSGVEAEIDCGHGSLERLSADYLVGCDGGSSAVRQQLGIRLEGRAAVSEMLHVFFRCDDLLDRHPLGAARHYNIVGEVAAGLITQDDLRRYAIHGNLAADTDPRWLVDHIVGAPVPAEILHVGTWTPHLLVAERYGEGRVFLAGDAAHQYIPTGGFGLNTGIGDAADLTWKLAAAAAGWAGPSLLDSYDAERRPVGVRNRTGSTIAARGHTRWRRAFDDGLRGDELVALIDYEQRKSHEMRGIELGYRYSGSPVVVGAPDAAEPDFFVYEPTTEPGSRLPHVWLDDGTSVYDRLGDGFTLLRLGAVDVDPLAESLRRRHVPVEILQIDERPARDVFEASAVLVRPDLHVAWRGSSAPRDPDRIAAAVTGNTPNGQRGDAWK